LGREGRRDEVAQTMYTHVNKCKNDERKKLKLVNRKKEIKNERQDCKIGTVWGVLVGRRRINEEIKVKEYG
jgi:hypothetical protein